MAKKPNGGDEQKAKRVRVSQTDVPAYPLSEALRVPRAIHENYGGHPTKPLDVAAAMDLKPGSSYFKMLTGAAIAYGLTDGGYNASEISITALGKQILQPLEEGAEISGKRQAVQKPRIVGEFLAKYDGSPVPKDQIGKNVLISMGVPAERAEQVFDLIVTSAKELGLLREIKGSNYVNLSPADGFTGVVEEDYEPEEDEHIDFEDGSGSSGSSQIDTQINTLPVSQLKPQNNRKVFITHGKNQAFIEPIRKLLKFGEMEAVVSVEKQSVSKPVPDKVMADMRECGAAIIHVEDELTLMDKDANEHVVLNPNVLIEIGAAMALYGRKFILLVKDGVKLPSNLQGLYEVRYEGNALDGNATIKLLESINAMKSEGET